MPFQAYCAPHPGEKRREPVRLGDVLHRQGQGQLESVAPLQGAGEVHAAQHGLGRLGAVARDEGVVGDGDVAIADALGEAGHLGGGAVLLVGPGPEGAVAIEAALVWGGAPLGGVGLVEEVVDHVQEGLAVTGLVGGPHVIGVVVVGDVDALGRGLTGSPGARQGKQEHEDKQNPPHVRRFVIWDFEEDEMYRFIYFRKAESCQEKSVLGLSI